MSRMRTFRWGLGTAAVLWAACLPVAAYAASSGRGNLHDGFALAVYGIGSLICHQRPERSFSLWMVALPVCARCTGIYIGGAVAAIGLPVRLKADTTYNTSSVVVSGFSRTSPSTMLILAAMPSALTLLYEWTTGSAPSNWVRAAAGLPPGWAIVGMIGALCNFDARPSKTARQAVTTK